MRKKLIYMLVTFAAAGMLWACSGETKESSDGETQAQGETVELPAAYEAGGWTITLEDKRNDKTLENISEILGYTDSDTNEVHKEASEGKRFCLLKLKFEKGDSKEAIEWEKMKLTDGDGNEYSRTDDTFLNDLDMKRLSGTSLNFGSNEGWIAFEVEEDADNLVLTYSFEAETVEIPVE